MLPGEFPFMNEPYKSGCEITFQAVTNCKAWDYLIYNDPDPSKGFMWTCDETLNAISEECERLGAGHSGCSFALCMRTMQLIAKHGWDEYRENISRYK